MAAVEAAEVGDDDEADGAASTEAEEARLKEEEAGRGETAAVRLAGDWPTSATEPSREGDSLD